MKAPHPLCLVFLLSSLVSCPHPAQRHTEPPSLAPEFLYLPPWSISLSGLLFDIHNYMQLNLSSQRPLMKDCCQPDSGHYNQFPLAARVLKRCCISTDVFKIMERCLYIPDWRWMSFWIICWTVPQSIIKHFPARRTNSSTDYTSVISSAETSQAKQSWSGLLRSKVSDVNVRKTVRISVFVIVADSL